MSKTVYFSLWCLWALRTILKNIHAQRFEKDLSVFTQVHFYSLLVIIASTFFKIKLIHYINLGSTEVTNQS